MYERTIEMERLLENEKFYMRSRALHITGKTEDAEDLLQDTIVKVYKGFDRFERNTNFRAWANKIMINTHINNTRKVLQGMISFDETHVIYNYDSFNDTQRVPVLNNPEIIFFQNHINEKIIELLSSLPEKYLTAFNLYHFEDYSYKEISSFVKLPVGTIKSRIFRAKQFLSERVRGLNMAETSAH